MIDYTLDDDGIAALSWNLPGRSQNVLNGESCAAFFAAASRALQDAAVKGILVTSAKPDFIAGGDLEWLQASDDAETLFARTCELHRALRALETGGKPVAIAMPGSALGGGLEIALAGHYRVAADNPKARFGLPEVTLGLLPGGGGTQRLPRLVGIQASLPLLLEGKRLKAADALAAGILHAVVPAGEEIAAARAWLLDASRRTATQPWDVKGFRIPGGALTHPSVQQVFMAANALARQKTYGNYPAVASILSCVYEGLLTDLDTGLKTEARYFVKAVLSPQAKAMIRTLFFGMNEANKLAARPAGVPTQRYRKIGVLGAGMMGAGIAYVSAKAGLDVVLIDTSEEAAARGKDYSRKLVDKQVQRGRLTREKADALLAKIVPTTDYARLDGAELVIEAVFEDRAIKADVTRRSETVLAPDALFASNTSTLPITGLAQASARPANFIGLHFFSPVDKMPLVEVIVGRDTSEATLARALDYVKTIGMTPIVVNDSRGFYTSRVFSTYVLEGLAMLAEGVAPALIENAGLLAGMPVGPLALTDEVSSELIHKITKQTRADLGDAYVARPGEDVAARMVELGRLGRKAGLGYYDYPANGGKKALWPGLAQAFPVAAEQPDVAALIERLVTVQAVETARCLEERVLTTARDADVGAILGWGFPAFRGGPVSYIHGVGVDAFVATCDRLAARYGARFAAPGLLREMAAQGRSFY
ncbi:enoyl-CoA hydratase/isomerase family protein [Burkholderia thailandensis E264]|uniref:Fatty oxidation complex, alpha subunit n=1 Tax=Burkholderia thailandensis (strain ATCC 700388 / DSM 13276 / CCUG 48851 / CIP 106301 / E264) TaxID=271848 RepID=Q2T2J1_BURTA|nr:3-hydroxyacyl-CoA dehydrogenase NAD-binding domain-containing protein [Burkholderia thailandensis]ABC37159.1 fatty oxidation complex, alpha subunit [Burkholderia thailandensis E264]AHI72022.1 enoyl-CoA hydratase/isomerase family protein [Burkholderia thailandensis 2002721723]AIP24665.1 enoyl-CoA hydratase/isomerase family protein [Burkholderia thailandensis E264]AJX98462.1 enoyl-CoA hydratase/isomerase family protein [Burkholderia thailandensis 2002721643]NBC91907.1 3-hydroxyacyl-CoA dehydr